MERGQGYKCEDMLQSHPPKIKMCLCKDDYLLLKNLTKYMKRDRLLSASWPPVSSLAFMEGCPSDALPVDMAPESLCVQEMRVSDESLDLRLSPEGSEESCHNEGQKERDLEEDLKEWGFVKEEPPPLPVLPGQQVVQEHSYSCTRRSQFPWQLKNHLDLTLHKYPGIPWLLVPWPSQH